MVRAETEVAARKLAESHTSQATPIRHGRPIPLNPWDTFASTCEDVTDQYANIHLVDGLPAVLGRGEGEHR